MSQSASASVLVGVSGGIAAFKAVTVVRLLKKAGYDVHVVPTANALRMVGAATWEAVSGHPVTVDPFTGAADSLHVNLGKQADAVILVPATANLIGKISNGIADDMLTTTFLTATCPVFICPAMHTQMWQAPAVKENVAKLRARGYHFIGPVSGDLTSGDSGEGRLAEPEEIFARFESQFRSHTHSETEATNADQLADSPLRDKHVVVTAGGTREPIDPVRFLSNRSSGRQGAALAEAALKAGAQKVTLVNVNMEVPLPEGVEEVKVSSTLELEKALDELFDSLDVLIMCAAVSDYRPAVVSEEKLKKTASDTFSLELVKNPDLLAQLGARPREGKVLVGFAAETAGGQAGLDFAKRKIQAKQADLLVYNQVGNEQGFGDRPNQVQVINRQGEILGQAAGSKQLVAEKIIEIIINQSILKDAASS
ncbi:hypothetical protein BSR28_04160 [Boudabousia liubingyangii]|uniref:bifunctional phosphopantothenoylcysteine decarboxylase/phosphopantothenate--cysteine ligase CoaBC n=1 Tax=Boudabousia liubingyangii TaxID=1921764 RepID=UPI00093D6695|nr:bifunctional phosphopantothenoylcysteine decarboxylase/phosphopantothenate--cysteine ligase CoaBC [Boudabousia liubingyangii]OKL47690.1 hypothetical protein BSR28_04160 [Boudabousia liubingyangii]